MYNRAVNHTHPMLRAVLKSQYHASLAMLREAIERCPPEEWLSTNHKNKFCQFSYHALFFAHLYLQHDEAHLGCGNSIAARATASRVSRTRKRRCSSTGSSAIG